jgi:hypothetical protein
MRAAVQHRLGEVAEWSNVPDSKSGVAFTLPWVRIPPSPPIISFTPSGAVYGTRLYPCDSQVLFHAVSSRLLQSGRHWRHNSSEMSHNKNMTPASLLLTLMLALVSTGAMARGTDWTWIGEGREHAVDYYLDFQSFYKEGQYVTVWELMDFEIPQEFKGADWKYLSSKLQIEFDCNERQSRYLSVYYYAGAMASDTMVYTASFPSATWQPIPTESVEKQLWNSACVKM